MNMVAEGFKTAPVVRPLAGFHGAAVPVCSSIGPAVNVESAAASRDGGVIVPAAVHRPEAA
jgi:hypothetical protein